MGCCSLPIYWYGSGGILRIATTACTFLTRALWRPLRTSKYWVCVSSGASLVLLYQFLLKATEDRCMSIGSRQKRTGRGGKDHATILDGKALAANVRRRLNVKLKSWTENRDLQSLL